MGAKAKDKPKLKGPMRHCWDECRKGKRTPSLMPLCDVSSLKY